MDRNDQYDKEMEKMKEMLKNQKYSEIKQLCESILSGDLKYRCDNADFWIMYVSAEKVFEFLIGIIIVENWKSRFCNRVV